VQFLVQPLAKISVSVAVQVPLENATFGKSFEFYAAVCRK